MNKSQLPSESGSTGGLRQNTDRTRSRLDLWVAGLLFVSLLVGMLFSRAPAASKLPTQERITAKSLTNLPVVIDEMKSCNCWSGPRVGLGQRKVKFRITNESSNKINIGGGISSDIRLVVVYFGAPPSLSFLSPTGRGTPLAVGNPDDVTVFEGASLSDVNGTLVIGSNGLFGVPPSATVAFFPPVENALVEIVNGAATHVTYVEEEELLPKSMYFDERAGHGSWNFYFPLPPSMSKIIPPIGSGISIPLFKFDKQITMLGVAVLKNGKLVGFSPMPSSSAVNEIDL